jgi:cellulose synthase/poly-beta-1,6-N-acetylglucosamine synthase-like glycosyltransferase
LLECVAAVLIKPLLVCEGKWQNTKITVLIPAHNEDISIASTLETITPVLKKQDKVAVVADNFSDKTAEIACKIDATVVERYDSTNKGICLLAALILAWNKFAVESIPSQKLLIIPSFFRDRA